MTTLRSNTERAKTARIFMIIMAVASIASLLIEIYRYYIFKNIYTGDVTYAEAVAFDQMYLIFSVVNVVITIVAAIFFVMWFRRAYWNLHQLTKGLRYSEGWAAGAWFIPIFSLFGPYQIATDLFSKTETLLSEQGLIEPKPSIHSIKGWWWALWIAGSIIGNFSSDSSYDLLIMTVVASIISSALLTGAAILAVKVVDNYNEMEEQLKHLEDTSLANPDNPELLDSM